MIRSPAAIVATDCKKEVSGPFSNSPDTSEIMPKE